MADTVSLLMTGSLGIDRSGLLVERVDDGRNIASCDTFAILPACKIARVQLAVDTRYKYLGNCLLARHGGKTRLKTNVAIICT